MTGVYNTLQMEGKKQLLVCVCETDPELVINLANIG